MQGCYTSVYTYASLHPLCGYLDSLISLTFHYFVTHKRFYSEKVADIKNECFYQTLFYLFLLFGVTKHMLQ